MNKKVFIYAYTQLNLGDDLFIKILCERYPEDKFFIVSGKSKSYAFKEIKNLTVLPYIPYINRILKKIHITKNINSTLKRAMSYYCDAIVNIGGSIFMESSDWEDIIFEYEKSIIPGKPFYIIGSNFGPFNDLDYYEKYKILFKKVTDICFRDHYSYDLFSNLPNVRYAPDVVFSYSPKSNNKIIEKKQIIISVIDLTNRSDLKEFHIQYKEKIIELARYFSSMGYSVILMGFCETEGDNKIINEIMNNFNDSERNSIISYNYTGNIEESLKNIQESQFVIATRFHSMIIGWMLGKKVYPLIYSKKSLNVIEDLGIDCKYTMIKNISELNSREVFNYLVGSKPLDLEESVNAANLQFDKLDEYLLKNKELK